MYDTQLFELIIGYTFQIRHWYSFYLGLEWYIIQGKKNICTVSPSPTFSDPSTLFVAKLKWGGLVVNPYQDNKFCTLIRISGVHLDPNRYWFTTIIWFPISCFLHFVWIEVLVGAHMRPLPELWHTFWNFDEFFTLCEIFEKKSI